MSSDCAAAGIEVDVGVERDAALELNAPFFFVQRAPSRPWVTLKLALSADGGVADPTGAHRWITGPESRRDVHRLRANADAIAVGIGTVLADDPELTVRDVPPPRVAPRRVVFDSTLRTPPSSKLVRTARETPTHVHRSRGSSVSDRRRRPSFWDWECEVMASPALRDSPRGPLRCAASARCSSKAGRVWRERSCANRWSTASLSFGHRWCSATERLMRSSSRPLGSARRSIGFASSKSVGSAMTP